MTKEEADTAPLVAAPAPPIPARPRIYVACLAAYNAGFLHGEWINVTTPEEILAAVKTMLRASPMRNSDEWAIHDYEGFEGASIAEYASFETVCDLADFIIEHGVLGAELLRYFGGDLEGARTAFEDYAGEFNSAAEFAEQLHEDIGTEIPDSLRNYIDWDALARDMALNGDITIIETGFSDIHIFWSR
ncbi:MAG: antirestriction protein ArdA [Pseudomonadota bacterium]